MAGVDHEQPSPFRVGDRVRYRPSEKGLALDANFSGTQRLIPGHEYVVKAIQDGSYVLVEGDTHPGGGLYWTEFERA